jgi:hypothetical protein
MADKAGSSAQWRPRGPTAGQTDPLQLTRNSHATPAKPLIGRAGFAYFCRPKPLESLDYFHLAKVGVVGSNPIARSNKIKLLDAGRNSSFCATGTGMQECHWPCAGPAGRP